MDTTSRVALSPPVGAMNHVVLTKPKVASLSTSDLKRRKETLDWIVLGTLFSSYTCLVFSLYMTALQPLTHISTSTLIVAWVSTIVLGTAFLVANQHWKRYDKALRGN